MMIRLRRDNFNPDYLPSMNSIPSNRINISLKISINSRTMLNIAHRIFNEFNAIVDAGPIDVEPGFKIKFKQHLDKSWKETIVLLVEGWAASHAVVGAFMLYNHIDIELVHIPSLELFGIGSVAGVIYFIQAYRKYQKIVEE